MKRVVLGVLLLLSLRADAAQTLRVASAGPVGEVATIEEANEVRVVFSEPMIVIGKATQAVPSFFHIDPPARGTFRWSGTNTLIFAPARMPYASTYQVTIDPSATSVAGNTLDKPYRWSFTTPTVRLMSVQWYRKPDRSVVFALFFNQPVSAKTLLPHVRVQTSAHEFEPPAIPASGLEELKKREPQAIVAFENKRAEAARAAASEGEPIFVFIPDSWDQLKLGPPSLDKVVLETRPGIPAETDFTIILDAKLAPRGGAVPSGRAQEYKIAVERALFVIGLTCAERCDPDSYNAIRFRTRDALMFGQVRAAVSVTDITDPKKETPLPQAKHENQEDFDYPGETFSLDALGFSLQPARRYLVRVDPTLSSNDGQVLGYTWMGTVENWHRSAFISFGDGQGVWESSGGSILPFHARNLRGVKQWLAPLSIEQTMPALIRLRDNGFRSAPSKTAENRRLSPAADKIQSFGLDIKPAAGDDNKGLLWAAMQPGEAIARSRIFDPSIRATIVQATNLGISVKDSPQNTIVLVTRLDSAEPVPGANVSIRNRRNEVVWSGVTDANGIAVADAGQLRTWQPEASRKDEVNEWEYTYHALQDLHFIVIAEKDGDVAYIASDWNEGITPWEFGVNFNINEAIPLLRGTIFTDRGVYKLGEEIHFKAIARSDTPSGMQLLPAGTALEIVLTDSQGRQIDKRVVRLNEWSSADWTFTLPADAPLGNYSVTGKRESDRDPAISGAFLVAAYRRPDFRVDVTLDAPTSVAGTILDGSIVGRYLYGGVMANRPVSWTYSQVHLMDVPSSVSDKFPLEQYSFLGWDWDKGPPPPRTVERSEEANLDEKGELSLELETAKDAGWPRQYRLEGEVTDVTRQTIANRATFRVDPAPWYIGLRTPPYFAEAEKGVDTEVVAAGLDGRAAAGVPVHLTLTRIQWTSVRQAVGNGFYEWQTERKEIESGTWDVTTEAQPAPLHIPLPAGGYYKLEAVAQDDEGRSTTTRLWFYAVGAGYTAWERYDHNRIDLVPNRKTFKPGDTAEIMIKSPWETATALLTTEREGIRSWKQFQLTSTQQTVTVPIGEKDIPNVFVSVLLVKGRTQDAVTEDGGDPGKPSFRLGYVELKVEDETRRLQVGVKANREEYRPATKARVEVNVRDAAGKPSQSEVTLWAVDYGVLSLTAYQTPDVLGSIYLDKALQVVNADSRLRIVSRRVITPKGGGEGGGGGRDGGGETLRKDFRVLAFWLGSIVTDAKGMARTEVTLPESLTTYRIMAVAGDRASRFGWGQAEIRINKPLMITPAFPRFLETGDKAYFGAVVHSQLRRAGRATVTIASLDPNVIAFGENSATVEVPAGSSNEVRFEATAKAVGRARIQVRANIGRERDAFEEVIPVMVHVTPETVAAYGEAKPQAQETLQIPAGIVPGYGGLHVELASTAMVGLAEGASYLVTYPYGCAEQRASAALALVLAGDLGEAFSLPGIEPGKMRETAQTTITELRRFQCGDGGFSFWPGDCTSTSPYLTSYVLHVMQRGQKLGYTVDADTLSRGYEYLERSLGESRPDNEGFMPAYTSWQAFAVKILVEGGRNADSHINRLFEYVDRMPIFGISYLADALVAKGDRGPRLADLHRRIANSILPEGGFAHVEELSDPYLLWFWNSNIRSTAIALGTLVRHGENEDLVKRMVRWMMRVREDGRWGNTQENAWAMEALVDYYRKYEAEEPNFLGVTTLGQETIAREEFRGRTTEAKSRDIAIDRIPRGMLPLLFERQGTGTLFYLARLRYAVTGTLDAVDNGFSVTRTYASSETGAPLTAFGAGQLIRVTLKIRNTKERRFVAVTDPIPAGTEPVETEFATTASENVEQQALQSTWSWQWWMRGGFDRVERHDDRVNVFAMRLSEGDHDFSYLLRATTAGTFMTAPTHVEEMYEPEVFGRTGSAVVEVRR
jgi:uncharacterized protein YfaS (alpha-2-macroglobulin family)